MSAHFREGRERKFSRQIAAAIALGITPEVLCRIEKGKQMPSRQLLIRMADVYDCSIDFLLGRDGTAILPNGSMGSDILNRQ